MNSDVRELLRAFIAEHAMSGIITPHEVLSNILKEINLREEDFSGDRQELLFNVVNGIIATIPTEKLFARECRVKLEPSNPAASARFPLEELMEEPSLKYLACKFAPMCKLTETEMLQETYYSPDVQSVLELRHGSEDLLFVFMGRAAMTVCARDNLTFQPKLPYIQSFGKPKGAVPHTIEEVVPIGMKDDPLWQEAFKWIIATTSVYYLRDEYSFSDLVSDTHDWMEDFMRHVTDGDYGKWKLVDFMSQESLLKFPPTMVRDAYYNADISRFTRWDVALNAVTKECKLLYKARWHEEVE